MQGNSRPLDIKKAYFESEEKYKRLTQLIPIAMYSTDSNGLITFYNKTASKLWGRSPRLNDPSELLYCGSWKLYDAEGRQIQHHECPMAKALRYQRVYREAEIGIGRPDGTIIHASANIDLIYDMDGQITGAINVLDDISERRKAEENSRWLAAIVESSEDAIISKNLNSVITSWNKGAEKIFGYTEDEVKGKHIHVLIPLERQDEEDLILENIRNGREMKHFETIRITKNGNRINVSLSISPVKNTKGEIIGASKIARDITSQVQIKHKLENYNKKLTKLNKAKDDFIGVASHELKTPITIVKAHLELIDNELKASNVKLLINRTLRQVDKLADLVSDLLDVSRIKEGKMMFRFSTFNLNDLIDECINGLQLTHATHRFLKEGFLEEINITADWQRLEQVVCNLLTNAVKYSRGADKIIVKTNLSDGQVMVSIQDFGVGIPQEYIRKIFTRFFRVEGQAGKYAGLGIGLYISKEIIKRHQGKIWAKSQEGKGSEFCFQLPLQQ